MPEVHPEGPQARDAVVTNRVATAELIALLTAQVAQEAGCTAELVRLSPPRRRAAGNC